MREMFGPTTRLRATAEALGCAKLTCAWLPMSKPCQLMMALWLDWVMSMRVPLVAMAACPAATVPPVGKAPGARSAAASGWPAAMAISATARPARRRPLLLLPQPRASSEATTQALRRWFQTRR